MAAAGAADGPAAPPDEAGDIAGDDAGAVRLDVRHLPPPLPMLRVLEALERLPAGGTLHVHHSRRPIYLYPRLDALGCMHETAELVPGRVELVIRKPGHAASRA